MTDLLARIFKIDKRIARNTLVTYFGFGIQVLMALFQVKILTNWLSKATLGAYFYAFGLSLFAMGIAMAGSQAVCTRFIPYFEANGRRDDAEGLLGALTAIYFILGVLGIILLETFVPEVKRFGAARAALILGYMQVLSFALQGQRKMVAFAVIPTTFTVVHNLTIFLLRRSLEPQVIFVSMALWATLGIVVEMAVMGLNVSLRKSTSVFGEIFHFWMFSFANGLLYPILMYADRAIMWGFTSPSEVALFSVAKKASEAIRRTLHVLSHVAAPEISYDSVLGDGAVAKIYWKSYILMSLLLAALAIAFGKKIIVILATKAYLPSYKYLVLLVLAVVISSPWESAAIVEYSKGRMNRSFGLWATWSAIYLLLAVVLASKIGGIGVALAYISASALLTAYVLRDVFKFQFTQRAR